MTNVKKVIHYPTGGKLLIFWTGGCRYLGSPKYQEHKAKCSSIPTHKENKETLPICLKINLHSEATASRLIDKLFSSVHTNEKELGKSSFSALSEEKPESMGVKVKIMPKQNVHSSRTNSPSYLRLATFR